MIIRKHAYPRAGLVGNPSDGYFGKTIAFTFRNFRAEVLLYETPTLEILSNPRDHSRFGSVAELAEDVRLFGYYGGIRLLKAAIKRFWDYCLETGVEMGSRNFTIQYRSDVPHLVGLAGSSAIITACFRALMEFYGVAIEKPLLANLILSVEKDELGISAGLQDRVAQVYQGLVYMDFDRALMDSRGFGDYDEIEVSLLPRLYIAYRADLSQGSEVFHSDLRQRFLRGDPKVLEAVAYWAGLADETRTLLLAGRGAELGRILDANFDRRREVFLLSPGNLKMVEAARSAGASAKFTGSGGAIIGTCEDDEMLRRLETRLDPLGVKVIEPEIALAAGEEAS